jgi:hypothetical protein
MIKPKYIFLTLSLVGLTLGLGNVGHNVFFYEALPAGSILFGLFMIAQVLEKESALYTEEQRARETSPESGKNAKKHFNLQPEVAHNPALTTARSS